MSLSVDVAIKQLIARAVASRDDEITRLCQQVRELQLEVERLEIAQRVAPSTTSKAVPKYVDVPHRVSTRGSTSMSTALMLVARDNLGKVLRTKEIIHQALCHYAALNSGNTRQYGRHGVSCILNQSPYWAPDMFGHWRSLDPKENL